MTQRRNLEISNIMKLSCFFLSFSTQFETCALYPMAVPDMLAVKRTGAKRKGLSFCSQLAAIVRIPSWNVAVRKFLQIHKLFTQTLFFLALSSTWPYFIILVVRAYTRKCAINWNEIAECAKMSLNWPFVLLSIVGRNGTAPRLVPTRRRIHSKIWPHISRTVEISCQ